MKNITSLIPTEVTIIEAAAKNLKLAVEKEREELYRAEVRKVMMRTRFLRRRLTESEAEQRVIARTNIWSPWEMHGWYLYEIAKNLLSACAVAKGGVVYLSIADAALVSEYKPK